MDSRGLRPLVFDDFTVDPRTHRVLGRLGEVHLTRREFDMLHQLASHPQWVYTAEQLSDDGCPGYAGSVPVHMSRLRHKLEQAGLPGLIETVRGAGYRLAVAGRLDSEAAPVLTTAEFLGREREIAVLWDATTALCDAGSLVLISGEAGIGKTTLMRSFQRTLREQMGPASTVWASCDGNGSPEYWPWRQVLREVPCAEDPADTFERKLLASLLDAGLQSVPPPSTDRVALFEAVRHRLQCASHGASLVIFLEDLHLSDKPSLELLRYLSRRMHDMHVLMAASFRDEGLGFDERATILGDISREPGSTLLSLAGLQQDHLAELIAEGFPQTDVDAWAPRIHELSGGNPLIALETLRAIRDRGVTAADDLRGVRPTLAFMTLVRERASRLPAASLSLLLTATALGTSFDLSCLAFVADVPPAAAVALLDPPIRERLIVTGEHPGTFRFAHPLTREVLYDSLPSDERAEIHAQAGDWYRHSAIKDERTVAKMAHHYSNAVAAGRQREAIISLVCVSSSAMRHFGYERALRDLRTALGLLTSGPDMKRGDVWRFVLLERIGDCLVGLDQTADAWESYQDASEARTAPGAAAVVRISTKLARTAMDCRRWSDALAALEQGAGALEQWSSRGSSRERSWVELRIQRAWHSYFTGTPEDPLQLENDLMAIAEHAGPVQASELLGCLVALDWARNRHVTTDKGMEWARRQWELVQHVPSPNIRGRALGVHGAAFLYAGEPLKAEHHSRECLDLAQRANDPHMQCIALTHLAAIARCRADIETVSVLSSEIISLASEQSWTELAGCAHGNLAWVALRRGDHAAVEGPAWQGLELVSRFPGYPMRWSATWPLLTLHLCRDELADAVAHARDMLGPLRQAHPVDVEERLKEAAQTWDEGDVEGARIHLAEATQIAERYGHTPYSDMI